MRNFYLLICCFFLTSSVTGQNVQAFGLSNSSDQMAHYSVYDNAGNLFVIGAFAGTNYDVDPSSGTFYLNSQGAKDFFIAKYSSTGTFISAISVGGTDTDEAVRIAIDGFGDVYVTGWFRNTVDFDPSGGVSNVTSNGHSGTDFGYNGEVFLAKYNNSLSYQWAFNLGGSFIDDAGLTVKATVDGGILLGGNFRGSNIDFDPSPATAARSAQGVIESFVAKYNSSGQFMWVSTIGGATSVNGQVRDVDVDSNGDIYVLGHFDGSVDLDPGAGANVVNSAGCGDIYLVKLNSTGQHLWGFRVGGTACDYPNAIAIDPSNNCYITGYYSSSNVDFNPGPATNSFSSFNSNYDIFVAKYDMNGNYGFAQSFGGSGHDLGFDLHVTSGSYILVGYFEGTVDFDASGTTNSLTSAGGQDGYVAGYYPNGQFKNAFKFGGTSNDAAYSVTKRAANEFMITGYYEGTNIDFDPGATQALLTSAGGKDAFFAIYSVVVLPLNLVEFTAKKEDKINRLSWTTAQELNTVYFEIERSANGKEFYFMGKLAASGGVDANNYTYTDVHPYAGKNYYRLRIVDKDGKFEYSPIREIDNVRSISLELFPNPVTDRLTLKIYADEKGKGEVAIVGVDGKIYIRENIVFEQGITSNSINTIALNSGVYFLRVTTGTSVEILKFIK